MTDYTPPTLRYKDNYQHIDEFAYSHALLASKPLGWNGVEALVFAMDAVQDQSIIPELATPHDTIILHLEGVEKLKRRFEGRWTQGLTAPGQFTLNPRNAPVLFHWSQASTTIGVSFTPAFITNIIQEIGQGDPMHVEMIAQFNEVDPLVVQISYALLGEMQMGGLGGRLYAESLGQTLAIHALRNYASVTPIRVTPKGKLSPAEVGRVIDYIEAHLREDIGIAELAACVGFSLPYFTQQFKAAIGCINICSSAGWNARWNYSLFPG
jgi:AraC family transcriptional regulator